MKTLYAMLASLLMLSSVSASKIPSPTIPDGLGVNIHFTGEPVKDLDMIEAAGFRFIRMDFGWGGIEQTKGVYDFTQYDQLLDGLQKRHIRPIFILDYSNGLYEKDRSVRTPEGRVAFAKFAAAGAKRYKGRGVVWELWNEPNIAFWEPQPSLDDYMALAKTVIPAIREADPDSTCIAPATSTVDMKFLEGCFKLGLLNLVDAVSIHPYRQQLPETADSDIYALRTLITRYSPDKPNIPIISGEWGYSTAWPLMNDTIQGQYLPRQFLTNLSLGIPLSIWYDWHDDGPDPKEPEHRFGTVTQDYKPKPSYLAMQKLYKALDGMHFVKRLKSDPKDYLLLFSNGNRLAVAAWTTRESHELAVIPGSKAKLTADPQYLQVPESAKSLVADGSWQVETRSTAVQAGVPSAHKSAPYIAIRMNNPTSRTINIRLSALYGEGITGSFTGPAHFAIKPGASKMLGWRGKITRYDKGAYPVNIMADIDGYKSTQQVTFNITNPVNISFMLLPDNRPAVILNKPAGKSFTGSLYINNGASATPAKYILKLSADNSDISVKSSNGKAIEYISQPNDVIIPLKDSTSARLDKLSAVYKSGNSIISESGLSRIIPLKVNAKNTSLLSDGDANVPATFKLDDTKITNPDYGNINAAHFDFEYGKGWKFVKIDLKSTLSVTGKPALIGVWVNGDSSGTSLRVRFDDSNNRTFQSDYGKIDFKGWRFLEAKLDDPSVGHWGGTGSDKKIAYPIRITSIMLIDGIQAPLKGQLDFADFQLIYKK